MTQSAKLKLEYLQNSAANQTLANTSFALLDQIVQAGVKRKDLATPPDSPNNGDAYIVAASPTGVWSGKTGQIAYWLTDANAWQFIVPLLGWMVSVLDELDANNVPKRYGYTGSAWSVPDVTGGGVTSVNARTGAVTVLVPIIIACSDETTALTAGTAKVTFRMPYAFTVTAVRASLNVAQTSGSIFTVDINEGASSILSTKLTIDNTEKTSVTAATPPVISDTSLADDAEITIDIDQIGDGSAKGLKVTLIGYQP
ncbi:MULTISPECIES: DUF2793 domain-containing protein [unclassified Pseudomonas]|uniref:DUF2793 domain-containing protein n=1 Tax=unclassified Pseudomonas TaxID=196821 RepID=UPI00298D45EE|nr:MULTISPECIES: DUF2793 domain-containing protein [unclassified Pseudomonas]